MKQKLSAVLVSAALLTGTFAYSNDTKPTRTTSKEVAINSSFQKIELGSNIQMVLIQDEKSTAVVIEGDENFIPAVNVSIDKGILSIKSKQNLKNRQIKVYVPVTTLSLIDLGNNASVTSEGILILDDLTVIVRDGSAANLQVVGNLEIEPADGTDLVYDTYKKSRVVYVHN